jgi:trigger factor
MKTEVKNLPRGQAELTVELSAEEYQPYLEIAVKKISEQIKIPGFRPGKAGFDIIKAKVGEAEIWQEALEPAVKKTLFAALTEQKLDTVGQPQVDVIKMAPGNPVVYKATVSLLPETKVDDYKKIEIKKKPIIVKDDEIKKILANMQKMRAKEALVDRPAQAGDKVEIDFDTFLDKIPIDNGQHKKFPVVIGDNTFIPGFEDQLIGLKKDETKTFQLKFPENYFQKNLAGKLVDFKVTVLAVFQRDLPALDDDFAKTLGQFKTLKETEDKIRENLEHEAEHAEEHRQEEELIDKLIAASSFGDIPDLLVSSESQKMMEEMEYNVQSQGLEFTDYLTHLKKTREELLLDFAPQAIKRVKSALLVREIGLAENISASEEEIGQEIEKTLAQYGRDPEIEKNINAPAYRGYLRNVLLSKKTMDRLKELLIK